MRTDVLRLRHDLAVGSEQAAGEILGVVDRNGARRPADRRAHLAHGRDERLSQDLERDRIDRAGHTQLRLQNEAAKGIERDAPVRRHDGGGAALLDERRARHGITWRQLVAVEDVTSAAPCRRRSRRGCRRLRPASERPAAIDARQLSACPTIPMPRADSLRSRSCAPVVRSIAGRVDLAECALDIARCLRHRARPARRARTTGRRSACRGLRRSGGAPAQSLLRRVRLRRRAAAPASAARTSAMPVLAVGETRVRTKSRRTSAISRPSAEKLPGKGGTTTVCIPSSSAISAACSGPAPPNGKQRKVARIDAAHHRHFLDGAGEGNGGMPQDALRHLPPASGRAARQARRSAASAAPRSSAISPPSGWFDAEPAEQYVGIRDGRLRSAAAVAGGAGQGSRRARPDREEACRCQRRDASAADADRVDVDLADLDRERRRHGLPSSWRIRRHARRQTSVDVPPMSQVMRSG